MASSLKRLKQINNKDKFAVFGYIRETENESSLLTIPMMIYYLCLAYYFQEDYFDESRSNMAISADKLTATHNGEWAYAYCKQWIDSHVEQITKWIIKINHLNKANLQSNCMQFCITSNCKAPRYRFHSNGCLWTFYGNHRTITEDEGVVFNTNDILSIILNTKKRTICFIKNQEEIRIIFREIKVDPTVRYKLAVTSYNDKNSVSLIHYSSDLIE